ncbi:hypothetical protein F4777DRAFT_425655 [Nemania sp. FL0916]|nr:hypothetical protein F4777DRAFT_425655 [Nemania sp. FL0916]
MTGYHWLSWGMSASHPRRRLRSRMEERGLVSGVVRDAVVQIGEGLIGTDTARTVEVHRRGICNRCPYVHTCVGCKPPVRRSHHTVCMYVRMHSDDGTDRQRVWTTGIYLIPPILLLGTPGVLKDSDFSLFLLFSLTSMLSFWIVITGLGVVYSTVEVDRNRRLGTHFLSIICLRILRIVS